MIRIAFLSTLAAACIAPVAAAQPAQAIEARARGVVAYRAMEYEAAADLLRSGLERRSADLTRSQRAEMFGYLGAAEHWLGREAAAGASFREAVRAWPAFRLDTLIFPLPILKAFDEARARTAFIDVEAVADTSFIVGQGRTTFLLRASAPHPVRVDVCDPEGISIRRVYEGAMAESLTVNWDGTMRSVSAAARRSLGLCIESTNGTSIERSRPLRIEVVLSREPATGPARSATDAERAQRMAVARKSSTGALVLGVVTAGFMAATPAMVSESRRGTSVRFALGISAIGAALYAGHATRSAAAGSPSTSPAVTSSLSDVPIRIRVRTRPAGDGDL